MSTFIIRNILLFLKDKMAVFFSFLAVFVVYFLYLCFLKDAMIKGMEEQFGVLGEEICNAWIVAGTVGILTLTSSLSILGILISDRSLHLLADFHLTPISSSKITMGYILSTTILTFFVSLCALGIGECYIAYHGGVMLSIQALLQIGGILLLSIFACSSVLFCILIWFKSTSSFSNLTTIVGTLSGFLMGVYLPIGALPQFLQTTIRYFPFSQGTSLLRQVMMEDVLSRAAFPNPESRDSFDEMFGLVFHYNDILCTPWMSILILCILSIIGSFCACCFMSRMQKHIT